MGLKILFFLSPFSRIRLLVRINSVYIYYLRWIKGCSFCCLFSLFNKQLQNTDVIRCLKRFTSNFTSASDNTFLYVSSWKPIQTNNIIPSFSTWKINCKSFWNSNQQTLLSTTENMFQTNIVDCSQLIIS